MARRRARTMSSSLCSEVLCTLERIFALEGPDEPDLGLNIAFLSSCRALSRFALAEPWEVPGRTVEAIRGAVARIEAMDDPHQLEQQLQSFPAWVMRMLDRRRSDRESASGPHPLRRVGDHRPIPRTPAHGSSWATR